MFYFISLIFLLKFEIYILKLIESLDTFLFPPLHFLKRVYNECREKIF